MREKIEDRSILSQFFQTISTQFNKIVKCVQIDNGGEFIALKTYFLDHGIEHQTTMPYTPQQNGRVECTHHHILNVARALRFQAHLPVFFWGECIFTVEYLIIRTPSSLCWNPQVKTK